MTEDHVILVNDNDEAIGTMEKMAAHEQGALHRAFSVFVFNSSGALLIHRRADSKYHSAGLWTNTCCSHPRPGETTSAAAQRRLVEEMGMSLDLNEVFSFQYRADFDNGLIEHELDHVLFGWSDELPTINPEEVAEFKYVELNELTEWIKTRPEDFTVWFKICLPNVVEALRRVA